MNSTAPQQSVLSEAQLMSIVSSAQEAIITIDQSQRIVLFNPAAERIFGCPAASAIGESLSRFIPERFRAAHIEHVARFGSTLAGKRPMGPQRLLFGLRADGAEFPIEASISSAHDGAGKLLTVVLRDATAFVAAQEALLRSHEALRNLSANLQQVREEEQMRIARELHDDLGQQLTALKMDVSFIEQALVAYPDAAELRGRAHAMRRLIDATVASVRRIAADLRPTLLDDLGLVSAIDWLLNDFAGRYGIAVESTIEVDDDHFSNCAATALFRIVQEALTNVARHAQASAITLQLYRRGERCVLRIQDNGRGRDTSAEPGQRSFGLLGIRERAHGLGGEVTIESAAGQGFAIEAVFPEASLVGGEASR